MAVKVQQAIKGQPAEVTRLQHRDKKSYAPLPYSLSALQIDAAKAFGLSAQQVLDSCQQLYERHKLITYPRSDCRYVPLAHFAQAAQIAKAIAANAPALNAGIAGADLQLKSKAWDDSKVAAHHAIIPTAKVLSASRLNATEQKLYGLIARQYLMQFYPPHCFTESTAELRIAGGSFIARARQQKVAGWKTLLVSRDGPGTESKAAAKGDEPPIQQTLPPLKEGQALLCSNSTLLEKQTQPPAHFTDASLLSAMTGIARYVQDPAVKRILKDTDGLGTEATRAGIIELLFKRGFLQRDGKQITATIAGTALITALPPEASLPDMTASWEAGLTSICQRTLSYQAFMQPLTAGLQQLIQQASGITPQGLGKGGATSWGGKARNKSTTQNGGRRNNSRKKPGYDRAARTPKAGEKAASGMKTVSIS